MRLPKPVSLRQPQKMNNEPVEQSKRNISDKALRRLVRIWTWVGAILLAAAIIYLSGIISNAIGTIVWTIVFVFILRGPVNGLDKHGVNRTIGTLLSFVLLIAVIGLLLLVIFSPMFGIRDQFVNLMNSLPTIVSDFQAWASDFYSKYADVLQSEEVRNWLTNTLQSFGCRALLRQAHRASSTRARRWATSSCASALPWSSRFGCSSSCRTSAAKHVASSAPSTRKTPT